jgi:hypothetical protein
MKSVQARTDGKTVPDTKILNSMHSPHQKPIKYIEINVHTQNYLNLVPASHTGKSYGDEIAKSTNKFQRRAATDICRSNRSNALH